MLEPASFQNDTIAALSTPPGRGGIGIVRLSGPSARSIAEPLLRLRHPLAHAQARFAQVLDPEDAGVVLDEAIVTLFAAPRSYTTEDVVEIACHGSPVLLETLLRAALARGARLAEPGEFTRRAFLAGRLDLTQAEAVHDLVASQTLHQARVAAAQLGGSLSRSVTPLKRQLIELIATLEAGVDFAEDDVDLLADDAIVCRLEPLRDALEALAASYSYGRILHEGFTLALIGRPNAGKSSLFNRLLAQDRAIVTPIPGTTRDPIAETLSLGGIPLRLVDTAGLRSVPDGPEGEPEREGIARTHSAIAEADLLLYVVDAGSQALDDPGIAGALNHRGSSLTVLNKIDLLPPGFAIPEGILPVSALNGQGVDELRAALLRILNQAAPAGDSPLLTTLRQQEAVAQALTAVIAATQAVVNHLPHELLLLDLYAALAALDQLTGATAPDEILHLIFSTFCIGK